MASLDRNLRRDLANTIGRARRLAEDGARAIVGSLAVDRKEAHSGTDETGRALRVKLRAHGRQLGDVRAADGSQAIDRLTTEVAYEHWHRILFARFLAENDLLVMPGSSVAISLEEVQELARDKGRDWLDYAGECASRMLPQIFRPDDPALQISLAREVREKLEGLVTGLPAQLFKADDSLGWVYQFWQAEKKEQVNSSGVKIGADELPAVTQLFTEDYMVLFLLENTLGAWWAGKRLAENPDFASSAADEDELRRRLSPPGYSWTNLRFVKDDGGTWCPAAGTFSGWPGTAREITVLDPCMGSGHFLVFALDILVAMRAAEEELGETEAVEAVLRDNLNGLEIDPRCTQIAAFALALAAWKRIGGVQELPRLNLACSGLTIGMGKAEFVRLAEYIAEAEGFGGSSPDLLGRERTPMEDRALTLRKGGLERLHDLFVRAPVLGSLIDPRRALGDYGTIFSEGFDSLAVVLERVLAKSEGDPETREAAVTAQGLAKAAELLSRQFTLVATNVPYLGRGDQSEYLASFGKTFYPNANKDLATMFHVRNLHSVSNEGTYVVVSPVNWLFVGGYSKLRSEIFNSTHFIFDARLGARAFETITGEVVNVSLLTLSKTIPKASHKICVMDHSSKTDATAKREGLITNEVKFVYQQKQLTHPDQRLIHHEIDFTAMLSRYVNTTKGLTTNDDGRFSRMFWEQPRIGKGWDFQQSTTSRGDIYGGLEKIVFFENGRGALRELNRAQTLDRKRDLQGSGAWGSRGISVSLMNKIVPSIYMGEKFDTNVTAVTIKSPENITAIYCFFASEEFTRSLRIIDQKLSIQNTTVAKIPFDLTYWQQTASENFPNGLPLPWSNDPTQWLFEGHPRGSADPNRLDAGGRPIRPGMAEHPLQVAVARLLGYRWPRQTGSSFMDCPTLSEPDQIDLSGAVDVDGIVCLAPLAGESDAATRLRDLIRHVWGPDHKVETLNELLRAEGHEAIDFGVWLRDHFFEEHCAIFQQSPFIFHIWDGRRDGFHALVNYHNLAGPNGEGRRTLEKLTFTYLGRWITRQEDEARDGREGAEARLAAAKKLKTELESILAGEPPYDIFVRWKSLHEQPIGWDPQIEDGVRVNIRPFLTAKPFGKDTSASACILRVRPRVKHGPNPDRGTEPQRSKDEYPWFWGWDGSSTDFLGGPAFDGKRWNDLHYTVRVKTEARGKWRAA
ncbi:hypothetical protein ASF22_08100 [Methylobacterium sp. Leaf87]|uniref:N-6 DNA methylase n=1 Tax=Methylobacterium sp. Leaf87 TaxID=1736243 RepID=UPI0006F972C1|nr:N-6 DNA methylase [Methylobacterium sp. Leaf87]KQO59591.1 hypothetical protein ASF22_08100 [Methylobacterium sp. Leaf87]